MGPAIPSSIQCLYYCSRNRCMIRRVQNEMWELDVRMRMTTESPPALLFCRCPITALSPAIRIGWKTAA